ncbi:MAG: hypothetical protein FWD61_12105 [Phycisphaerales bacterium]|nr:hypothetical protein [Phycisphaerales bacterium]
MAIDSTKLTEIGQKIHDLQKRHEAAQATVASTAKEMNAVRDALHEESRQLRAKHQPAITEAHNKNTEAVQTAAKINAELTKAQAELQRYLAKGETTET